MNQLATGSVFLVVLVACGAPAPSVEGRFQTVQAVSTLDGTPPVVSQVLVTVTRGSPNWQVSFQGDSGGTCLEEATQLPSGDPTLMIEGSVGPGCLMILDGGGFLGIIASGSLTVDVDGNLSGIQTGTIGSSVDAGHSFVQTNAGFRVP